MRAELSIQRLSKSGQGVGTFGGRAVFVEGALPQERVLVDLQEGGKAQRGHLVEVLSSSPARRPPACALSDRCGGCDWLHLDEVAQREAKQEILLSALEHIGGLGRGRIPVLSPIISPRQMGYRRRATMHFFGGELCFYERRSHQPVPVPRCPAMVPALEDLPARLAPILAGIAGEVTAVHLISAATGASFALELKKPVRSVHVELCEKAARQLGLKGAVLVPPSGSARIVGKPILRDTEERDGQPALYVRPDAFAQVNPEVNAALVRCVLDRVAPLPGERVLELFSGNGNFTFPIAAQAGEVLAVESSGAAVELARRSAREVGVSNVRFIQEDAAKTCEALIAEGARFDALVADPPRTGAHGIGSWARGLGARRAVYVGCDPAALARDCAELGGNHYSLVSVQPVDMFPQTRQVEAVIAFARDERAE